MSEYSYHNGQHISEHIMGMARQADIACATVSRGLNGYGWSRSKTKNGQRSGIQSRPIVIELIDSEERNNWFSHGLEGGVLRKFADCGRLRKVTVSVLASSLCQRRRLQLFRVQRTDDPLARIIFVKFRDIFEVFQQIA